MRHFPVDDINVALPTVVQCKFSCHIRVRWIHLQYTSISHTVHSTQLVL